MDTCGSWQMAAIYTVTLQESGIKLFFFFNLTVMVLTSISIFHPSSESLAHIKSPPIIIRKGSKGLNLSFRNIYSKPWQRCTPLQDDRKCLHRSCDSVLTLSKNDI